MSISPPDAQRSVPKHSPLDTKQNFNSGHGFPPSQQNRASLVSRTNAPLSASSCSALDSDTGKACAHPVEMSGANHGNFQDHKPGASKIVGKWKDSNVMKHSISKNSDCSQHQPLGKRGSSRFNKLNKLDSQHTGRPSTVINMPCSDHFLLGASNIQFASTQLTLRRREASNANHLLNFHYDPVPRSHQQHQLTPSRRPQSIKPYNKDLFLQSNFKFVVYDSGNYSIESIDPDKMFSWDDVVCVRYSTPIPIQCPICLENPLCPQITSCGHIYCLSCVLRYLLVGVEEHRGDSWKKCPLCFSMISSKDLYTIRIDNVIQFHVGHHVEFVLLTRTKDSLIPMLKSQDGAGFTSTSSDDISNPFSKFIFSSDVELSVRDAKVDLSDWLCKAEAGAVDDLERLPYACAALEHLEGRMKKWMENRCFNETTTQLNHLALSSRPKVIHRSSLLNPSLSSYVDTKHVKFDANPKNCSIYEEQGTSKKLWCCSPTEMHLDSSEVILDEEKDLPKDSCKDFRGRDLYNFYQVFDGQPLILHPLCMKCLLHHYGSHELLPSRISGVILELETITQSEAMRKRYRFLSHFSLTTTFQLCEIDLSKILPPASLAPFMDEIKKREKHRKLLAKKERDEKARAEAANCAKVASLREMLNPTKQKYLRGKDTIFSLDEFEALGNGIMPTSSYAAMSDTKKLFSNVTRLGYAAGHDSPAALIDKEPTISSVRMDDKQEASGSHGRRSFANILSSSSKSGKNSNEVVARKGKKQQNMILLSNAGGRRY